MIDLPSAAHIMLAAQDGAVIECSAINGDDWHISKEPDWDWCRMKYRIRKEPFEKSLGEIVHESLGYGDFDKSDSAWQTRCHAAGNAVKEAIAGSVIPDKDGCVPFEGFEKAEQHRQSILEERDNSGESTQECSACHAPLCLNDECEWPEDERDIVCSSCSGEVIHDMRIALADAIRRPMGIVPESAARFLNDDDRRESETRRMKYHKEGT